jgi:hypothetical protein
VICIYSQFLLDRQVDAYLATRDDLSKDERTDIRYYMDTWLASHLTGKVKPTKTELAAIVSKVRSPIESTIFAQCLRTVMASYRANGGNARAAKGPDVLSSLLAEINRTPQNA